MMAIGDAVEHIQKDQRQKQSLVNGSQAATPAPNKSQNSILEYEIPPKIPSGMPDLSPVKPKTPIQNGGGLRKRWKDKDGNIYEWDYQHGEVEKYNPDTGEQTKPPDPKREVEP
jgi:hypothetical protein